MRPPVCPDPHPDFDGKGDEELAKSALARQLDADEAQVDKLLEVLAQKWGEGRNCPYCQSSNWSVGNELLRISRLRGDRFQPFFGVICDTCGNTVLIEPEAVDLWPSGQHES